MRLNAGWRMTHTPSGVSYASQNTKLIWVLEEIVVHERGTQGRAHVAIAQGNGCINIGFKCVLGLGERGLSSGERHKL
jgi:hypothetical protein